MSRIVYKLNRWDRNRNLRRLQRAGLLTIGRHTYGSPRVHSWTWKIPLRIGAFTSIADSVDIFLDGNHRTDWLSTYPFTERLSAFPSAVGVEGHPTSSGPVSIGNDVWIGRGALILSGVSIGDGAVIGASSVVTRDVGAYEVVAGNPARFIRSRFEPAVVDKLLESRWWEWPDDRIDRNLGKLMAPPSDNIDFLP